MRSSVSLTCCALVVCLLAPVRAQDQFERIVRQQLEEVGKRLQKSGYEPTHQVFVGRLNKNGSEVVMFQLRAGVKYAIVGVCDQDCKDVDLRVSDPSDREIGADVEPDDAPVVEFQARQTGEYDVRVEMADCKDEPCVYGIGIFATGVDAFERQVRSQLESAASRLGQKGFTLTHHVYTGMLKEGEREDVSLELDAARRYVIVGVCDNDCKDLDLQLLNRGGREIDRDVERDDYPLLAVQPTSDDRFTIRALMAQCSSNPCRYGFGVFAR